MDKFERNLLRYPRGSVWNADLSYLPKESGVQSGDRPVLIFSSDIGNYSSDSVMCLTITSNMDKAGHSVNVSFMNDRNEENVILCNQMHTINKSRLKSMVGILPEYIINKAEEAHSMACGSKRPEANIECVEKAVNNIIVAFEKRSLIEHNKVRLEQEQVNKIAAQLEEIFRDVVIPLERAKKEAPILTAFTESKTVEQPKVAESTQKTTEEAESTSTEIKDNSAESKTNAAPKNKEKSSDRKPRGFWTEEKKAEFIEDRHKLSIEDLMQKWNFASIKSVYSMYYVFRRDLDASKSGGKD